MKLDPIQQASQDQFARQSQRYAKSHILADIADVDAALAGIELPMPAEVLDVATGAGHTGLHLASLGHRVTVSDVTEAMLERAAEAARERALKVTFNQHAAEELPYDDETFDLVTCRVAAHHFSAPDRFVRETARVLKRGGYFLLIDGSVEDNQPEAEEWMHQIEKRRDGSHHRLLTPGVCRTLCEANRLGVLHSELTPFKQPDLEWYFETANTTPENRVKVLDLVRDAPESARRIFQLGEEEGKIVWWWQRLTLLAQKASQ